MKKLIVAMLLSVSLSAFASVPPVVETTEVAGSSFGGVQGIAVFSAVVAGMVLIMYKHSQAPVMACSSEKPVTAKWIGAGYQFVTTACDFQANAGKMVAVN
mgnify:CR=1 FL=1